MTTIINGSSPSITFSDGTTQTTAAVTTNIYTVVFASSGSWTAPTGVTKIYAYCVAGGGGGGGTGQSDAPGRTGGGGGAAWGQLTVVPGTTYTITVGAGGAGSNTTTGSTGGTSSIGALMSCTGGVGSSANDVGANGSGSGGTVFNGAVRNAYTNVLALFPFGMGQFFGLPYRAAAASSTAAVAWSISSTFLPGAGGEGEAGVNSNNSSGGIGGAVIIEYVGA